tara:strand:+ start:241 stop:495 length:255 start_codon:yes stop_codon:yes gene_type:complete
MELRMKIINEQDVPVNQTLVVDKPNIDTTADLIVIAKYTIKAVSQVPVFGWILAILLVGVVLASISIFPLILFMMVYHYIHKGK